MSFHNKIYIIIYDVLLYFNNINININNNINKEYI